MSALEAALRQPATWPRRRPKPTVERLADTQERLFEAALRGVAHEPLRALAIAKLDQAIDEVLERAGALPRGWYNDSIYTTVDREGRP